MPEITSMTVLPAKREDVSFVTEDGLTLVGELALPLNEKPVGTILFLHPLPTAGGFMDSHILRKASNRLPALANIAVLRFNFRGVTSPRGTSEGEFGNGVAEQYDFAAALDFIKSRGLPTPWVIGWSFGTEVALCHSLDKVVAGLILLSPPLHRTSDEVLNQWAKKDTPIVALIPEHDDYLKPQQARERFALVPHIELVEVAEGKHLWVGEKQTRIVLNEITKRVNPAAVPLPNEYI